MKRFTFDAENEEATAAFGAALAELLPDGSVIALSGTLGAGKTQLVQAVARASGVDPRDVVSPTFVLVHEYAGRRPIFHFDVYRLKDEDEFLELGPEEYFERPGVTFVEWADRVARCLPAGRLEIHIDITGPTSRRFTVTGIGDRHAAVVDRLWNACPQSD
jgi:tRNA threonylcarbamoyladenosine biosynthesis protein TsaE